MNKKIINPIFLLSLTFLVWTISDYYNLNPWWPSLGAFIIIAGFFYRLNKKFGDSEDIDTFARKFFNSSLKTKLFLTIIFFSLSACLLLSYKNSDDKTENAVSRYFSGLVWDEEGEPLTQVVIFLPELNLADTTDNQGKFSFIISDTNFATISFIAQK